jgi:proline iminopeptidase
MTNNKLFLEADDIHSLAVYTAGNPQGLPIVYLHGGPGAGCDLKHFDTFDLTRCFVILHDQRGCGQSTPSGCLEKNTTWDLVADIEKIRRHFNLEKILLYGGSWGSTLALAYAETYPDKIIGLVLRSICLAKKSDYRWLYEFGANQLFPKAWQDFTANRKNNDIVHYYHQALNSTEPAVIESATLAWNNWAAACLGLPQMTALPDDQAAKNYLINLSRIETHYFSQNAFFEENQLLNNLNRIQALKCFIIHGEKDYLCPVANAVELHQAWPGSELILLPEAGHLSSSEGMQQALQSAVRNFLSEIPASEFHLSIKKFSQTGL